MSFSGPHLPDFPPIVLGGVLVRSRFGESVYDACELSLCFRIVDALRFYEERFSGVRISNGKEEFHQWRDLNSVDFGPCSLPRLSIGAGVENSSGDELSHGPVNDGRVVTK